MANIRYTSFCRHLALAASIACAFTATKVAAAPINFVSNGGFELNAGNGQLGGNTSLTSWSTAGYNFLFAPGTADTTGAQTSWFAGSLHLWGANNGGLNALQSSGNGGYIVGADGAYGQDPITQLINGLTPGRKYQLNFEWAAAQQAGFYGVTTEAWYVKLGDEAHATGIYTNASQSSSNWMSETMTFTATNSSALLSFLALGTPDGAPPFSLLDGVSLFELPEGGAAVPEPASWMLFGAVGIAALMARRRRPRAPAA